MHGLTQLVIGVVLMIWTFFKTLFAGSDRGSKEHHMNWWQLLAPIVADIIRRLLERKGQAMGVAGQQAPALASDAEFDQWAGQLETAVQQHRTQARGAPAGSDGGIIDHVNALIAALRSRDMGAILTVVRDILSHL